MRKNKVKSSHYKTAISRVHSLSLLIGFTILALTNSCTSSPPATRSLINDYYVDHNLGSDSNPGYQNLPWQTIQKAANTLSPGDTVTVTAGEYPEKSWLPALAQSALQSHFKLTAL